MIDLYRKVLPFLYLLMISGMPFSLYLRPSQWAIPQKISFSTFLKITEGLLVQREYSHHPLMTLLTAMIFALAESFVVLGESILRILPWKCLIALSGMSTLGIILPLVPILRMTLYPRKSNPSVI